MKGNIDGPTVKLILRYTSMHLYIFQPLYTIYLSLRDKCLGITVQKTKRNGSTLAVLCRAKTAKKSSTQKSQFTNFLVDDRPQR